MQLSFRLSTFRLRRRLAVTGLASRSGTVALCRFEGCDEDAAVGGASPLCALHQSLVDDLDGDSGAGADADAEPGIGGLADPPR